MISAMPSPRLEIPPIFTMISGLGRFLSALHFQHPKDNLFSSYALWKPINI